MEPKQKRSGHPLLSVKKSPVGGKGAFAKKVIPEGTRIIEYKGKRIRWPDDDDNEDYVFYFGGGEGDRVINPFDGGNEARFINHSCAPNCEAVEERGRIYIDAVRDISKGEELFYDYGLRLGRRPTEEDIKRYACNCRAPGCRGTMLHLPRKRTVKAPERS